MYTYILMYIYIYEHIYVHRSILHIYIYFRVCTYAHMYTGTVAKDLQKTEELATTEPEYHRH